MSQTKSRNGSIDILRFGGAVGIVWFHLSLPGAQLSLAALPMFVIFLVQFGAGRPLADRAQRLLIPWVIWSVIFALAKTGDALSSGTRLSDEFAPWMLLTGTALHLWFLPFCFGFLVLTRKLERGALWAVALGTSLLALWALNSTPLAVPFAQWASVLPAAFFGLLLARGNSTPWLSLGFVALMIALYGLGWDAGTLQLAIGAFATFIALQFKSPSRALGRTLSDLSLGIYLIHPLIYALALRLMNADGLAMFAVVFVFSILGTLALKRALPRSV